MRISLKRIAAGATTIAMAGSMLLSGPMARAAEATDVSDTLTRVKISETATHTLAGTFGTAIGQFELVSLDYDTAGFVLTPSTPACSFASGTCTANVVATGTDITCTSATCSGALTLGTFAGTNPGTAGSKTIAMSGSGGYTGSFAIAIVDDDQVTVTATVDPSITFDLDTAVADTDSDDPYTVALGTLSSASVRVSGTTDSINHIWMDLDTNASGGAVVTVRNANGSSGLVSASVSGDDIDNSAAAMSAGTENYGLCVVAVTQTTGTLAKAGDYATGTCATNSETNDVENLTTTAASIINTSGAPIAGGRAQIAVQAAIAGTQPAHNDYTDTLTFIATGTF